MVGAARSLELEPAGRTWDDLARPARSLARSGRSWSWGDSGSLGQARSLARSLEPELEGLGVLGQGRAARSLARAASWEDSGFLGQARSLARFVNELIFQDGGGLP